MDNLPVELRRQIFQHLELSSIKSLRLTSHANASVGEDFLVAPTFNTLIYRDDFTRLLALSQSSKYSHRITNLNINLAELNEFHARHNAYFLQFMREPEERDPLRDEAFSTYGSMRSQKEQFAETVCNSALLKEILPNLGNLESIAVTLATCPFSNELLQQIWRIPSSRALHRVLNTERFSAVLSCLVSASPTVCITSLSHDRLPFEFFAQRETLLSSIVDPVFKGLKKLSLSLDYSAMPNNRHSEQGYASLARCLACATELEELNLGFQGRSKIDINPLFRKFLGDKFPAAAAADDDPVMPDGESEADTEDLEQGQEKKVSLSDSSSSSTDEVKEGGSRVPSPLPNLRSLNLSCISTTSHLLKSFILLFSGTLQCLQLGSMGTVAPHQSPNGGILLTQGHFTSLFTALRKEIPGLQPEDGWRGIWLLGDLAMEEYGTTWKLERKISETQLQSIYSTD